VRFFFKIKHGELLWLLVVHVGCFVALLKPQAGNRQALDSGDGDRFRLGKTRLLRIARRTGKNKRRKRGKRSNKIFGKFGGIEAD
jgi:hypothetical protein